MDNGKLQFHYKYHWLKNITKKTLKYYDKIVNDKKITPGSKPLRLLHTI